MSDIIYHYTSLDTFNSIICNSKTETIELRATHIEYLNDLSEYKIALKILLSLLIDYENSLTVEVKKKGFSGLSSIEKLNSILKPWQEMPPFVCSFSENSDSLPMWNTYANKSLGIAIGFERKKLSDELKSKGIELKKCLYKENKVKDELKKNIDKVYNSFMLVSDKGIGTFMGKSSTAFNPIRKLASITKDNSFLYEKEWRAILKKKDTSPDIKFYSNNELLKMYISFDVLKSSIKEIVVGPCLDYDLVKKSLFMLLKNNDFNPDLFDSKDQKKVNIKKSKCPYRNI